MARIPIANVERACQRLDTLINECLERGHLGDYKDPALLRNLRVLGNEVYWLGTIVEALGIAKSEYVGLQQSYWTFKDHLTRGPDSRLIAAVDEARRVRQRSLQIQWLISKEVMERPKTIQNLMDQP